MYKDEWKKKETTKERVRRYREKQKGVTLEEGVTFLAKGSTNALLKLESTTGIPPAVVRALVNKRPMMEYISEDLKRKHLGDQLRYGVYGPTFEFISELLEVTNASS